MKSFHYSIDDVFSTLVYASDNKLSLIELPFFKTLRQLYDDFGVCTNLYTFGRAVIAGELRTLHDITSFKEDLREGWLKFGVHAADFDTPPYAQPVLDNISTFSDMHSQLIRLSGGCMSSSIRLHYYSECFELADFFLQRNIKELFTTDKPARCYRLPENCRLNLERKGSTDFNGLTFTSTDFRVENLANQGVSLSEFGKRCEELLAVKDRIIIYSHEYEHLRVDVCEHLYEKIAFLANELNLRSE